MDIDGALNVEHTLFDLLTIEANSINYEKLDYNNPANVKFKDVKFEGSWENVKSIIPTITAQRSVPTTLTINSILSNYVGQKEYTTRAPIDKPTWTIRDPAPISIIDGDEKGKTLIDLLFGNEDAVRLPLVKPNPTAQTHSDTINELLQIDAHNPVKLQGTIDLNELNPHLEHSGYDYDVNNCKIINDKILCGYNKNLGIIFDKSASTDLKDDCRMRDDRIECGYSGGIQNLNNEEYNTVNGKESNQTEKDKVVNTSLPPTSLKPKGLTLGMLLKKIIT